MEMEILNRLLGGHIDVKSAVERTAGNEALFLRLLKKFPAGQHYEKVVACLQRDDLVEAELHMHALKGVAGNLSMETLYKLCCTADADLKEGKKPDNLDALGQAYDDVIEAIASLP